MAFETAKKEKRDLNFPNRKEIGRDERLLYWCMPERIPEIDFLLKGTRRRLKEYGKPNSLPIKQQLDMLIEQFREKKLDLACVETLSSSLKKEFGLTTIFAIAPNLQPLYLKEYPAHSWGERISTVPQKLGLPVRKEIYSTIHPFP